MSSLITYFDTYELELTMKKKFNNLNGNLYSLLEIINMNNYHFNSQLFTLNSTCGNDISWPDSANIHNRKIS